MEKLILFDLDGTLVDTKGYIIKSLNSLSKEFKFDELDDKCIEKLRNTRSRNFLKVIKVPLWKAPFLIKRIQENLSNEISNMEFIDGIEDLLRSLKGKGYKLGVLTSNTQKNTKLFLEKYNGDFFDYIYSKVGILRKHKLFKKLIKQKKFLPENIVYIGDETRDIQAAKKAGIKIISVTWGFNSRSILNTLKPDYIVDKPEEIISLI